MRRAPSGSAPEPFWRQTIVAPSRSTRAYTLEEELRIRPDDVGVRELVVETVRELVVETSASACSYVGEVLRGLR